MGVLKRKIKVDKFLFSTIVKIIMGFWSWIAKIGLMLFGTIICFVTAVPLILMSLSFNFGHPIGSDLLLFIGLGGIFIVGFLMAMYERYKLR